MNDLSTDGMRLYVNGMDITHTISSLEFSLAPTDDTQEGPEASKGYMDEFEQYFESRDWKHKSAREIIQDILAAKRAAELSRSELEYQARVLLEDIIINNHWSTVNQHELWWQLYGRTTTENKNFYLTQCNPDPWVIRRS